MQSEHTVWDYTNLKVMLTRDGAQRNYRQGSDILVLSLFPGIGLLDRAFELEGFTVVRGPDLLWGGDVKRFHPPAGRFDGIIGGPPCQTFSRMSNINKAKGLKPPENLIPEFERCVWEAKPDWFLMENVPEAPAPSVRGYEVQKMMLNNRWVGGIQNRLRKFAYGQKRTRPLAAFSVDEHALEPAEYAACCTAAGTVLDEHKRRPAPKHSLEQVEEYKRLQGLPPDFDLPGFTVKAKIKALGNGVPLSMGKAIARAVRNACGTAQ